MNTPAASDRSSRLARLALTGLLTNLALATVKLLAGLVGHSFALVADAVESLVDVVGSAVIWSGLRIGARPPDDDHPYGHGRAEALAGLGVSIIVMIAGIAIAVESVHEIISPHNPPAPWTLLVLVVVVLTKETLARIAARAAKREGSDVTAVDAGHHRADAITSAAAFVGIVIALLGPVVFAPHPHWAAADDYAALLASGIIAYNGWSLSRLPLRELMDRQPEGLVDRARELARTVPGVVDIEKCRAFTRGSRCWIELHVEVDGAISVTEGHAIGGRVRQQLRQSDPRIADVHIHIEPARGASIV